MVNYNRGKALTDAIHVPVCALNEAKEMIKIMKKILICFAIVIIAGLFWFLSRPQNNYDEIIVENGQKYFTASFDTIYSVIPENEDIAEKELLDGKQIRITLIICDADGKNLYRFDSEQFGIHTNGFISKESFSLSGLPIKLEKGEKYSIEYWAFCGDTELNDLSFALGGQDRSFLLLDCIVIIALAGIIFGSVIWDRKRILAYMAVWMSVTAMLFMSVPYNQTDEERAAFSDAYAKSNEMLGRATADEDGYVYIPESGIRNMGYLSYSMPLYRFWTNNKYGNIRSDNKTSSLFMVSGRSSDIIILIDAVAITIARSLAAPYQIVYLSGKLLNQLLVLIIMLLCFQMFSRIRKRTNTDLMVCEYFLYAYFLLPSLIQSAFSYTSAGLVSATAMLVFILIAKNIFLPCSKNIISRIRVILICALSFLVIFCMCRPDIGFLRYQTDKAGSAVYSFLDASIRVSLGSVMNSVICSIDKWVGESILCYNSKNVEMFFLIYMIMFMFFMFWWNMQQRYAAVLIDYKGAGFYRIIRRIGIISSILIIAAVILCHPFQSTQNKYGIATGIIGCVFTPLILLPYMNRTHREICFDKRKLLFAIAMIDYFCAMKCLAE